MAVSGVWRDGTIQREPSGRVSRVWKSEGGTVLLGGGLESQPQDFTICGASIPTLRIDRALQSVVTDDQPSLFVPTATFWRARVTFVVERLYGTFAPLISARSEEQGFTRQRAVGLRRLGSWLPGVSGYWPW